jgi:hypothetical protein
MDALYKDTNIDVLEDENGDGFILKISGEHKDGSKFNVPIRSKEYLKADAEVGDGLLLPVESLDTFHTQAMQDVADKKGKIYEGLLLPTTDTVDLPSSGGDIYEMRNARRLQEGAIKATISKKANVTASGLIGTDSQSRLRTYVDYTLAQGPGWYDKNFKGSTPEEQKNTLTGLLTDKAFVELVKDLPRVTQKDGTIAYYNPDPPTGIKQKEKVGKVAKPTGQTGTQKNQVDFNARIKDVIATGEGGITKGGYTLEKDEQGLWALRDKDGLPKPGTEDQHNPYVLQKYIGGTLKKPLK